MEMEMGMEMGLGERFCICEARVWKREGKEVVVVVENLEEICLCKRANLKGGARYKDMQT